MGRLDGRVVLVTGAARGHGEGITRACVSEGAQVAIADVLDEAAERPAAELGEAAFALHLDVASESDWNTALGVITQKWGQLDGLVSNAGICRLLPLAQTTAAEARAMFDVNALGVLLGMNACAALLAASRGAIVNIASVDGLTGMPGLGGYVASKHAVVGLTKTAALEMSPTGIRVNAVCPGAIDSPTMDAAVEETGIDFQSRALAAGPARTRGEHQRDLRSDHPPALTGEHLLHGRGGPVDGGLLAGLYAPSSPH
jgi:3alpha(or 20beta)-hydroxysteroid dehydrogenase